MVELGQLEARHAEFTERNARIVAISLENREDAQLTQDQFPHLTVIADEGRGLAEAVEVIHPGSAIDGGDTTAPTTILVGGDGLVRSVFRADRFMRRLSPDEVLAAIDEHLPRR